MREHPFFPKLVRAIRHARSHAAPWEGTVFRAVELSWARPEYLISGEGTRQRGSRWMHAGITPVVQAAWIEALALAESRAAFAYYRVLEPRNNPRVSVEIAVSLRRVLNLVPIDAIFPDLTADELLSEDWQKVNEKGQETLAQAVGRDAWGAGVEGMLVPSAQDRRSRNLVWFPDNLGRDSSSEICGKKELEKRIAE